VNNVSHCEIFIKLYSVPQLDVSGIIFGKPYHEKYYDEYKKALLRVVAMESGRDDLPILYNINFGHAAPMCILPYGVMAEIDCSCKSLCITETAVT